MTEDQSKGIESQSYADFIACKNVYKISFLSYNNIDETNPIYNSLCSPNVQNNLKEFQSFYQSASDSFKILQKILHCPLLERVTIRHTSILTEDEERLVIEAKQKFKLIKKFRVCKIGR